MGGPDYFYYTNFGRKVNTVLPFLSARAGEGFFYIQQKVREKFCEKMLGGYVTVCLVYFFVKFGKMKVVYKSRVIKIDAEKVVVWGNAAYL